MTDVTTVQPGADPDAAKYAALKAELEASESPVPEPELQPESQQVEPQTEPEPQAKPSYEELEEHGRKTAGALKEAREQAQRERAEKAAILQIIEQARAQRQPEPKKDEPKAPTVEEDPIGFFKAEVARLELQLQQTQQGSRLTAEQLQAKAQHDQLMALVQRSEADILDPKSQSHKADYYAACEYLEGQRIAELEEMYPEGNPYVLQYARQQGFQDAQQLKLAILNHDRQAVAIQALQLGKSPAQVYYDLATRRGYQAKPNGKEPANGLDKGKAAIEATKRGQKAAVTLSGSDGGRKGSNDMSLSDLADLFVEDPELADKMWDQMARAGRLG